MSDTDTVPTGRCPVCERDRPLRDGVLDLHWPDKFTRLLCPASGKPPLWTEGELRTAEDGYEKRAIYEDGTMSDLMRAVLDEVAPELTRRVCRELAAKFRSIVSRCDHDSKLAKAYQMAALVCEEHAPPTTTEGAHDAAAR